MKKGLVAILLLVLAISAGCSTPNKYTIEQYYRIRPDMTYEEVKDILGDPGKLEASMEQPAIPDIIGAQRYSIYQWENSDGSKLAVTFSNNRVQFKSQSGLKYQNEK